MKEHSLSKYTKLLQIVEFLLVRNRVIITLGLLLAASFIHGWYYDYSKPQSGEGWADQTTYYQVTEKLATDTSLRPSDFHYQMGYSLLGAIFYPIIPADPFMPVSLLLLLVSLVFLYRGAKHHFSEGFLILFLALVFFRVGSVRELYYAQEIFLVPWNNQVLFFCFAYYFWVYSKRAVEGRIDVKVIYFSAFISGYTVATREESLLFATPLLALLLLDARSIRVALLAALFFVLAYMPNLIIKFMVVGSVFENVRPTDAGMGYMEKLSNYFSLSGFLRNIIEVVIDSSHSEIANVNRLALLQANPLFWLAPLGFLLYCYHHTYKNFFIYFLLISGLLLIFYLAGENMSAEKLKFHCLRYISPAFIALSFLAIYTISLGWQYYEKLINKIQIHNADISN